MLKLLDMIFVLTGMIIAFNHGWHDPSAGIVFTWIVFIYCGLVEFWIYATDPTAPDSVLAIWKVVKWILIILSGGILFLGLTGMSNKGSLK